MAMSVSSKLIMSGLKLSAAFNLYDTDADTIRKKAEKYNAKQKFSLPRSGRIVYTDAPVSTEKGTYHCLRMKRRGVRPDRAVIYIPGGGAVYNYCKLQMFLPKALLKHVDAEVFYPFYPPTTEVSLCENYSMIFECYKLALSEYDPSKTAVIGVSSGATAAMAMLTWNNIYKQLPEMPVLTIALSPGHVPVDGKEAEMLEAYRGIDPMVPVDFVKAYGKINDRLEELPAWMIHTAHGDFRNGEKIRMYWGEKESLAFSAPLYEKSLRKAGVDYKIHIEPGMPHTYACMRVNKACRDSYDEYVELIKKL